MSAPPLSVEAALARLTDALQPLRAETAPLAAALGRVTAEPVHALCDLPPFDQSAMDGYAVRAAEVAKVPRRLPLASTIAAGPHAALPALQAGSAARIYTGGLLPAGADTIVPQELTERDGEAVLLRQALPPGSNVRRRGEELRRGTQIAAAGRRLQPGLIAALAMAGVDSLALRHRPRVAVLVTGDEIIAPGNTLRPGEAYDANGPLLRAWFAARGYPPPPMHYVRDEPEAVREALERASGEAELIISTGGVSVGDRDFVAPEAEKLGAERLFWKVAQKPGKPVYAARLRGALLMGLPGNPASVLVNLAVFVQRALDVLEGLADPGPHLRHGLLASELRADAQRATWLRVRSEAGADGTLRLHALGRQASHMLSNLAEADALAWLPASAAPLKAGTRVRCVGL